MTKEYKINSSDIVGVGQDDCYLDPSDPAYALLGNDNLLHKHGVVEEEKKIESWEDKYAREHNIKPGSPAWFALRGK